ncbi:MAG TPA: MFS transporter [Paenibacillaceae bacterium]
MKKEQIEKEKRPASHAWAMLLFSVGVFMAQLDNGIISAALTTINRHFDVTDNWGAWGITLYTLGLSISLPIAGKLSDRYGRKKIFIVEVLLFGLGSLLVALSPTFGVYLAARFIQALGGGGIFIIGSSHILSTVEPGRQAKYLGMLGAMNGVAAVLGPNIGAFLLDWTGSWHVLFLINVPIAVFLLAMGFAKLWESADPSPGRLDTAGIAVLSLAVLSLMYGLTNIDTDFWESFRRAEVYGFLSSALGLFAILYVYESALERKADGDPILPMQLIRQPRYLTVLVIGALSGGTLAAMIFIPGFVENVLGIPAEKSGYWMTPLALASGVGAGMGGALVSKRGPVFAVVLSGVVAAAGFALIPLWTEAKWQFVVSSMIAGAGMGIILGAPLNILATEGLSANKGTALASLSLLRQVGMTIAPTIYAGFLARSYNRMGDLFATEFPGILQENVERAALPSEALAELSEIGRRMASGAETVDAGQASEIIASIRDPALREVVETSAAEITRMAAQNGYGGIYWAAAAMGVLIVLVAFILVPLRKSLSERLVRSRP